MKLDHLISAYSSVDPADDKSPFGVPAAYALPRFWTAAHVAKRLVDSFRIIDATTAKPGPKAFGNAWPDMERDVADLNDVQAWENHKQAYASAAARGRARPTAIEVAMAEEAILWASAALPPHSQEIDALHLWTVATARDLNVARILRRRQAQADAMIAALRRSMGLAPAVISDPEQLAATVRGVVATANIMLTDADAALKRARERAAEAAKLKDKVKAERRLRSAERAEREALEDAAYARKLAVQRIRRIVNVEGILARPPTERIRRSEVMPGKVFTQSVYDERRRIGATEIAERLHRLGVQVR